MSFPNVNATSIVGLWMQPRGEFARSQEESMIMDPGWTLTDPHMPLCGCTITSPVDAPCVVSDSGMDSPEDISVHSIEGVSIVNHDGLSVDPESDFFIMGQYFHEHYTHIFNSFTFQMAVPQSTPKPMPRARKIMRWRKKTYLEAPLLTTLLR